MLRGAETVLKRKSTYYVLLVAVVVVAGFLLMSSAWSQERGEKTSAQEAQSKKTSERQTQRTAEQKVQTQKSSTQKSDSLKAKVAAGNISIDKVLDAAESSGTGDLDGEPANESGDPINSLVINVNNCVIDANDSITFTVSGDTNIAFATVTNGVNADITSDGDSVTVESIDGSGQPIDFFTEHDNGTLHLETLDGGDELVVDNSSIDCGKNNNKHHRHHRHRNNGNNNNNNNNNQYNDNNDDNEDNDNNQYNDNGANINSEATTSTGDQYNDNNGGASASVGPGGASARAGGANAGRTPDQYAPESQPRGDVVNEIPTEGPLPNTGGVSVATGASLALVLFGAVLLAIRLVMIWRERRM